jgi:hypothetical protein
VTKFLTVGLHVQGYFGGPAPGNQPKLPAFVLPNTIGVFVNSRDSRSWGIRNRETLGTFRGRLTFCVINPASMVIRLRCLAASRHVLGLEGPLSHNIATHVVGVGLGTATRFWA